jgi:carboxyl-terminal processing protease
MQGKYQGIGASVEMNGKGNVVIVSPFEGSPAKEAGIRPGDIILEVNGESIEGYSLMEAINIIRGPEGTSVELLVKHLLSKETELITIIRSSIKLESVLLRSKPKSEIAHIRGTSFYPETADDLSNMINKSKKDGAKAILLDLRNNPGGLLTSVIDVTSLFLEDGVVIKEIDGYNREQIWKVKKSGPKYIDIPLVLLINNYSASASEVLAGALKDYKRATIAGETSFGKGSVGILRPLSNGGGISVTIAKWYTPNNNLIDKKGVVPDIEINSSDPSDTSGVQTEGTLEYINNNILNK